MEGGLGVESQRKFGKAFKIIRIYSIAFLVIWRLTKDPATSIRPKVMIKGAFLLWSFLGPVLCDGGMEHRGFSYFLSNA